MQRHLAAAARDRAAPRPRTLGGPVTVQQQAGERPQRRLGQRADAELGALAAALLANFEHRVWLDVERQL